MKESELKAADVRSAAEFFQRDRTPHPPALTPGRARRGTHSCRCRTRSRRSPGEAELNDADPVLNLVEQAARRSTLTAKRELRDGKPVYRLDIRLQGEGETVLFDI